MSMRNPALDLPLMLVDVRIVASDVVILDGVTLTAGAFTAIGTSGYSEARASLSNAGNGNHVITASAPIGISVYGYGQYTSYWYPGGMKLVP